MPREAGAGDRSGGVRRVAERKTHLEAEDALEGGRCIRRRRRRRKAEEAEAEFEMERRGGRGFPLQLWTNLDKLHNTTTSTALLDAT